MTPPPELLPAAHAGAAVEALAGTFNLPLAIDYSATFFAGVSGALVGVRHSYDIVGIFFLALLTGLGGAFLRDGIFLQQGPSVVINDGNYLLFVLAATAVGVCFRNKLHRVGKLIAIMDAVGLAAYAVLGTTKALAVGVSVSSSVLIGVVNAVGGGVMRDVCTREEPMIFRPSEFYALVAFLGSLLCAWLIHFHVAAATTAAYASMGVMLLARLLTIVFNWKTRPISHRKERRPPAPKREPPGAP